MSPTSSTPMADDDGTDHLFIARCPRCGTAPILEAFDSEGNTLDRTAFASSGGHIVPSDAFQEEYEVWRMSKAAGWRMVCQCDLPMTSGHRNSLIHRWNAGSTD